MSDARPGSLSAMTGFVTQITTLVTALTALATALFAFWNSMAANEASVVARKVAQMASNTTALQANIAEQRPVAASATASPMLVSPEATAAPAAGAPPSAGSGAFTVQLATYQTHDCPAAVQEIEGYNNAFSPAPKLWRDPAGQYVIIGVAVPDLAAAQALQKEARRLSQEPAQAGNDLGNAIIRRSPPWTVLAKCPGT